MIFGLSNVSYCDDSAVKFEELCELEYLEGIFSNLRSDLGSTFEGYDFQIYSANNTKGPTQKTSSKKTVLIYISDETMRIPEHLSDKYHAIFKCYIPVDRIGNIFSLPLGYVNGRKQSDRVEILNRDNNVFFSGNLNENRFPLYQHFNLFRYLPTWVFTRLYYRIKSKLKFNYSDYFPNSYINFTHKFNSGLSPEEYTRYLYNSKIILCPKGFTSAETFRHYEAMQSGGIVISQRLPDVFYYKNSPIIQIDSWAQLDEKVGELIGDDDRMKKIQQQTYKWWDEVCSEKAVSKYIAQSLSQL